MLPKQAGAIVHYNISATDNKSIIKPKDINCTSSSGSVFPIGNTTVSCIQKIKAIILQQNHFK